jgi:hypothetical protein
VVNVRIAEGKELPQAWRPGMPLTVGRSTEPYAAPSSGCPFGAQCYSCRNGLMWNPARGKHTTKRGQRPSTCCYITAQPYFAAKI